MIKPLIQKVVVAVNGSEQSIHAAMYGILLSKQYKCELKAIYVVDTSTLKQLTMSKFFYEEESRHYEQRLEDDGKRYLSYLEKLAKEKDVKISTELKKGAIWSELIKAADDFGASLILLGGKEHPNDTAQNSVRHDKISVTNAEIIGSASCNVLVVREPDIEKLFKIA
ncbi:MAG: universal stress protein [Treponema sp.]|uniref:universal stress protein n=1 Tax=Treponema sp. TaxID=166 RepID=UPI001B42D173|nr:universal stress protein [Treponema sp.]MBP3771497.1 universal stress protein [Treponema sp.]MBQ9282316.1 universal stress protein [Treponema sp.]